MPEYTFKRGSIIEIPFSLIHENPSFTWTGIDIRSSLRENTSDGPIFFNFEPICMYSGNAVGVLLTTSGHSTTGWNKSKYYGDIRVEGSGYFGPYYPAEYIIKLASHITP